MTLATVLTVLAVVAAASVFACIRYGVMERVNGSFPYGTLLINIAAAGLAGAASQLDDPWSAIVLIGALGTLSTWSAVAVEVGALARAGEGRTAVLYTIATVTTGLLAAWLGIQAAAL